MKVLSGQSFEEEKKVAKMPLMLLREIIQNSGDAIGDFLQKKLHDPVNQIKGDVEKKVSSLYLARVDTVGLIYKNGKRLKQNIPSLQSFVFGGTGASGSMFLSDHFYLMGRSMLKTYPWEFQFFNGLKIDGSVQRNKILNLKYQSEF